jgi:hypothetical protein
MRRITGVRLGSSRIGFHLPLNGQSHCGLTMRLPLSQRASISGSERSGWVIKRFSALRFQPPKPFRLAHWKNLGGSVLVALTHGTLIQATSLAGAQTAGRSRSLSRPGAFRRVLKSCPLALLGFSAGFEVGPFCKKASSLRDSDVPCCGFPTLKAGLTCAAPPARYSAASEGRARLEGPLIGPFSAGCEVVPCYRTTSMRKHPQMLRWAQHDGA